MRGRRLERMQPVSVPAVRATVRGSSRSGWAPSAAVVAVTALSRSAAPTAHGTRRPLTGTGTGTTTLNLLTGAATADFTGHLPPWEPKPATMT